MNDVVERVARAIENARQRRAYGLYDYSSYPGHDDPHVVRDEWTNKVIFRTDDRDAAQELFDRLTREHIARATIEEMLTPSPEMVAAGIKALAGAYWDDVAESDVNACWAGMLSAALADTSPDIGKEGKH